LIPLIRSCTARFPKLIPFNFTQVPKVTYEQVEIPYEEEVDASLLSTSKLSTANTERASSPSKSRLGGLLSWFSGKSDESGMKKKEVVYQSGLTDQNPSPPKYQTSSQTSSYPTNSCVTSEPTMYATSTPVGYSTPVKYATGYSTHSPARLLTYSANEYPGATSSRPVTTFPSTVNHGQALGSLLAQ
jgi:hypothetical protein